MLDRGEVLRQKADSRSKSSKFRANQKITKGAQVKPTEGLEDHEKLANLASGIYESVPENNETERKEEF